MKLRLLAVGRQAEELAQALKQHKRPENPFLEKTLSTRGIIVSEYKSIARELYKLGYKTEARAISRLSREVENAGTAARAQQEYDRAVQAEQQQTNRSTPAQSRDNGIER